ncbi:hypothetical protein FGD67_05260 [Colwellia sp. M166]|uniref:ETEC_3214 domain-containing protein n=1 Tax=Colwellia sp. M166 TaxID=2583805 RepID=UPI00211EFF85|nr:ETEC_3214 domain-containing protein [Colwellia sp. M166]UUO22655.1 hypothetical protein FGD67_05260 [Colwellia sp. M166]|tara:strand:- start:13932 stop:14687 length:756 start_codon:yes stop_codon:yes gene_type:complete
MFFWEEIKFKNGTFKDKFLFVAIAIMALGQWSDSKELAQEAYVAVISNFTHKYEYEALNKINIGSNMEYISQQIGFPQLIKKSKYIDDISFAYYLNEKYILTLILQDSRVTAYTISALADDFTPNNLLNKKPSENKISVADNTQNMTDFTLDYNNVDFFLTREELGKDKLFMNQYFGAIGYKKNINISAEELRKLYDEVNLEEDNSKVTQTRALNISQKARNNFFGAGEVDLSVIADSVLTNFEYSFYYKQ